MAEWWGGLLRRKGYAIVAWACAVLMVAGAVTGWYITQGRRPDGSWVTVLTYADVDGYSPEIATIFFALFIGVPALAVTTAWWVAPFGGHIGRALTLLVFGLAVLLLANMPSDFNIPYASLGRGHRDGTAVRGGRVGLPGGGPARRRAVVVGGNRRPRERFLFGSA